MYTLCISIITDFTDLMI